MTKWFDIELKYDVRDWNSDYSKCGKGITLLDEGLDSLLQYSKDRDEI